MQYLVFLMPLLGSLPIAVAAVVIARLWFRHRELRGDLAEQMGDIHAALEELRSSQMELQERVDFTERLLTQVRDQGRLPPAG